MGMLCLDRFLSCVLQHSKGWRWTCIGVLSKWAVGMLGMLGAVGMQGRMCDVGKVVPQSTCFASLAVTTLCMFHCKVVEQTAKRPMHYQTAINVLLDCVAAGMLNNSTASMWRMAWTWLQINPLHCCGHSCKAKPALETCN